jgi:predicted dehydrogenase
MRGDRSLTAAGSEPQPSCLWLGGALPAHRLRSEDHLDRRVVAESRVPELLPVFEAHGPEVEGRKAPVERAVVVPPVTAMTTLGERLSALKVAADVVDAVFTAVPPKIQFHPLLVELPAPSYVGSEKPHAVSLPAVATVHDPAIGLFEDRRIKVAVAFERTLARLVEQLRDSIDGVDLRGPAVDAKVRHVDDVQVAFA